MLIELILIRLQYVVNAVSPFDYGRRMEKEIPTAHKVLARNIKRAREKLDYSQQHLAERAELSPGYIHELEQGKKWPSADTLERLSAALGLEPFMFLLPPDYSHEFDAFDLLTDYAMSVKEGIEGAMERSLKQALQRTQSIQRTQHPHDEESSR